jgi:hypothetical protein
VQLPTWGFWRPISPELSRPGRCFPHPFDVRCWCWWIARNETGRRSRQPLPDEPIIQRTLAEGDHDAKRRAALAARIVVADAFLGHWMGDACVAGLRAVTVAGGPGGGSSMMPTADIPAIMVLVLLTRYGHTLIIQSCQDHDAAER